MATIKYTDKNGEHKGTLTMAEYCIYAFNANLNPHERVSYMTWDDTDYEPFKRAVGKKYNTEVLNASITRR